MFFIFGINSGSSSLGARICRSFACCGSLGAMAAVTCTYQVFTLFFLPIFRFGKRYFVTCPNCGTVYEMSKQEGHRIEQNPTAEISPEQIYPIQGTGRKICPKCRSAVDPSARFCPSCGTRLF